MENYTLQYASDLHLDSSSPPFDILIKPAAKDLALCGDIGDPWSAIYRDFLTWCAGRWERVFLLAGNHEYFAGEPAAWGGQDKTYDGINAEIRRICNEHSNIVFLQESTYRIDALRIVIVGTTLWTAPALRRWDKISSGFIGDPGCRGEYTAAYKPDEYTGKIRVFHPSDITDLYVHQSEFIKRYLNPTWGGVPEGYRVIILTHHLPSLRLNPEEFKEHPLISCYANSLDELLKEPVVAWICGHSHTAREMRLDTGCLLVLNPLGYKSEAGRNGYLRAATITVHPENIAMFKKV